MAQPVPEKRITEFEDLGFGVFVHWGLYSQLGKGEWVMSREKIPKETYQELIHTFTASRFDARQWAKTAKEAGAGYMTLTTRHHEGFSLYDTRGLSDYDVMHSPCGRDLVREYVEACREFGLKPFFYHTTLDWHRDSFGQDFSSYLKYLRDSVEILCSEYGPIGGLWFDGNWSKPDEDWEEDTLYAVIRKYQPQAIIVNNTGLGRRGALGNREIDSVTFEQGRPTPMDREGMEKYVAAEMCHTMNAHWGYGAQDFQYKSLSHLIETLCACRKVGANYLLNVGPTGEGEFPLMQAALLHGIGDWIRTVGSTIYHDRPCGICSIGSDKNFALRSGNKIHFYIHDLSISREAHVTVPEGSAGEQFFRGISGKIRSIRWTDQDEELDFSQYGEIVKIKCTPYPYGKNLVVRVAEAELIDE